jgi:5-hydroxyisourate hydrolase
VSQERSAITTHVLDTAVGRPAAGVPVRLEQVTAEGATDIGHSVTGPDGRVTDLGPGRLAPGRYRLVFDTGAYLARQPGSGTEPAFYPEVSVLFTAAGQPGEHYHLPLLLSPYGYSTYRGS